MPDELNWKGVLAFHFVRWALPLLSLGAFLALLRDRHRDPLTRTWSRWGVLAWCISRLGYATVLYGLLDYQGSGDMVYWREWAGRVLEGEVPGREWPSSYSPLFCYLQAGGLWVFPWWNGVGVLIPFIIGEGVLILSTWLIARDLHGSEAAAKIGWALLSCPLLWHEMLVGGQDEPLMAGFIALSLLLQYRGLAACVGLTLGLGIVSTKISVLMYAAPILLIRAQGLRSIAISMSALVGVVVSAAAVFSSVGASIVPVGGWMTQAHVSGIGIPSLVTQLSGSAHVLPWFGLVAVVMLGLLASMVKHREVRDPRVGPWAILGLAHAAFMVLMPGCLPSYGIQGVAFVVPVFCLRGHVLCKDVLRLGYGLTVALTCLGWMYGYVEQKWLITVAFCIFHAGFGVATWRMALRSNGGEQKN